MQFDFIWQERQCKTCFRTFLNERTSSLHIQQFTNHVLETTEERNDRVFRNLANDFTNSLTKRNSSISGSSRSGSSRQSSVSSPNRKRKNLSFTNPNLVSSEIYKESVDTRYNQDMTFILDDQESLDNLYGPEKDSFSTSASNSASPSPTQTPVTPISSLGGHSRRKSSSSSSMFRAPNTTSSFTNNSRPTTGRSLSSFGPTDDYNPTFFSPPPPSQSFNLPYSHINSLSNNSVSPQSPLPPPNLSFFAAGSSSSYSPYQGSSQSSTPTSLSPPLSLQSPQYYQSNSGSQYNKIGSGQTSLPSLRYESTYKNSRSRRGSINQEPIKLPSIEQILQNSDEFPGLDTNNNLKKNQNPKRK